MSPIRMVPYINVVTPSYSRHDDTTSWHEREMQIELRGDRLKIIHAEASPTNPYFAEFSVEELREILDNNEGAGT